MRFYPFRLCLILLPLLLAGCRSWQNVTAVQPERYEIGAEVVDPAVSTSDVDSLISPYREQLSAVMNEQIGTLEAALVKASPEGSLGNWIADIMAAKALVAEGDEIDFALQNSGGLRANEIPAGPLRPRQLYQVMPFDNTLVLMELDSQTVHRLVQHMADDGGWPVSRNLRYRIGTDGKARDIRIKGQPLRATRRYLIALPNYIADGGSDTVFLKDLDRQDTGRFIRDLMIEYVREQTAAGKVIKPVTDGRVSRD